MSKRVETVVKQISEHCEISIREHDSNLTVVNHWHDYFELELVLEGCYNHICNGEAYVAKPGDAWIMSYFDYHSIKALTDSKILNISFSPQYIPDELADFISLRSNILCKFDCETTKHLYNRSQGILKEFAEQPMFYHYIANSFVQEIIINVIREYGNNSGKETPALPKLLQSVTSYLNKNYKSDLALAATAEKFHISSGHLGFLFKKSFGTSYNNYVNRIRMKKACDLLTSSDIPAKEVAEQSGYNSVEYFFYIFKKHFNCTPIEYRENSRS